MKNKLILLYFINLFCFLIINHIQALEYSEREKDFEVKWEKKTDKKVFSIFSSRDKKNIFVYGVLEKGEIQAFLKENGEKAWDKSFKGSIDAIPVIADEKMFFGTKEGFFYSIDVYSGAEKWKNRVKKNISTSPLYYQDRVYFGAWDGYLYAFQSGSGKSIWKAKTNDAIGKTPVVYNSKIFLGSLDGFVYALDLRDGSELWKIKTGWAGTSFSPVIDKKNDLIILASTDKNIYALDPAKGNIQWKFETRLPGLKDEMLLINDRVIIPSYDGTLYCVNAKDGILNWKISLSNFFMVNPPYKDEMLFVATEHGELVSININNGIINWQNKIAERIQKRPQLFEDAIFLVSDQGYLYGIDILFGDISFQYITEYYPDYILYYDIAAEIFYYYSGEDKLIAFSRVKEKEELQNEEIKTETAREEIFAPPRFSPDGKYSLYDDYNIKNDHNLIRTEIIDNTHQNEVKLTQSRYDDVEPAWCPDSTCVIFSSNRNGNYDIYSMDMTKLEIHYFKEDGKEEECGRTENDTFEDLSKYTIEDVEKKYLTRITQDNGQKRFPMSSPTGEKILYSSNENGNWDLWIVDRKGKNKTRLTYEPADEEDAKFSPTGDKIVFTSARLRDKDIYVINPDGSNLIQLTQTDSDEIHPEWINDSTIVYEKVSPDKKFVNIWTAGTNGQETKSITTGFFNDIYPKPSPDGKRIAFISDRNNKKDNIWIVNNSGKGLVQITEILDEIHPVTWTPDNKRIVFFLRDIAKGIKSINYIDINQVSLQEQLVDAENFLHKNKFDQAWDIYENILEDYPNEKVMAFIEPTHFYLSSHLVAFYKMSIIEDRKKNYEHMVNLWQTIADDKSGDYDDQKMFSLIAAVRIKLVELLFKKERFDEAIESYKKILEDFPEIKNEFGYHMAPYISLRIAECYEKMKKFDQALKAYLQAIEKYPASRIMITEDYIGSMALAYINIGRIYDIQYKDYDNALQYYLKILEKYPNDNFVTSLGVIRGTYFDKALSNIKKIYSTKKINADNWINICILFKEAALLEKTKNAVQLTINDLEKIKKGESIAAISSQQAQIVFCSRKKTGMISAYNYEIFSMNEDKTDLKQLTFNDVNDYHPVWSPDGNKIIYHTLFEHNYEIFVMDVDGTHQQNLTANPAYDFEPAWSSDASQISFTSDRDVNKEIYIMNDDGSDLTNITQNPANDFESNWAPSGDKIIFSSDRDGNLEIYQIDIANGTITNLTKNDADDHEPVFSPNGENIVFNSNRDNNEEIYIMNSDGTNQRRLTNNRAFDYNPTWSSDGKYIYYISNVNNVPKIFKIKTDGTEQTQVTTDLESHDIQPNVKRGIKF